MQQFCKYGSVRGAAGNRRPYRDPYLLKNTLNSSTPQRFLALDSTL